MMHADHGGAAGHDGGAAVVAGPQPPATGQRPRRRAMAADDLPPHAHMLHGTRAVLCACSATN